MNIHIHYFLAYFLQKKHMSIYHLLSLLNFCSGHSCPDLDCLTADLRSGTPPEKRLPVKWSFVCWMFSSTLWTMFKAGFCMWLLLSILKYEKPCSGPLPIFSKLKLITCSIYTWKILLNTGRENLRKKRISYIDPSVDMVDSLPTIILKFVELTWVSYHMIQRR